VVEVEQPPAVEIKELVEDVEPPSRRRVEAEAEGASEPKRKLRSSPAKPKPKAKPSRRRGPSPPGTARPGLSRVRRAEPEYVEDYVEETEYVDEPAPSKSTCRAGRGLPDRGRGGGRAGPPRGAPPPAPDHEAPRPSHLRRENPDSRATSIARVHGACSSRRSRRRRDNAVNRCRGADRRRRVHASTQTSSRSRFPTPDVTIDIGTELNPRPRRRRRPAHRLRRGLRGRTASARCSRAPTWSSSPPGPGAAPGPAPLPWSPGRPRASVPAHVGIVTQPFAFEGARRMARQRRASPPRLRGRHADRRPQRELLHRARASHFDRRRLRGRRLRSAQAVQGIPTW